MNKFAIILAMFVAQSLQGECNQVKPVCGQNNVTYANSCMCVQAKVEVKYEAPCKVEVPEEPTYEWSLGKWRWGDWREPKTTQKTYKKVTGSGAKYVPHPRKVYFPAWGWDHGVWAGNFGGYPYSHYGGSWGHHGYPYGYHGYNNYGHDWSYGFHNHSVADHKAHKGHSHKFGGHQINWNKIAKADDPVAHKGWEQSTFEAPAESQWTSAPAAESHSEWKYSHNESAPSTDSWKSHSNVETHAHDNFDSAPHYHAESDNSHSHSQSSGSVGYDLSNVDHSHSKLTNIGFHSHANSAQAPRINFDDVPAGKSTSSEVTLNEGEWTTTSQPDDWWNGLEFADKYVGSARK